MSKLNTVWQYVTGRANKDLRAELSAVKADADTVRQALVIKSVKAEADVAKAVVAANNHTLSVLDSASKATHLAVLAARQDVAAKLKDVSPVIQNVVDDALAALEGKIILALA